MTQLSSIQTLKAEDLTAVNQLVSTAFGYHPPHQFFEDFPIWSISNDPARITHLGVFDESTSPRKLISHVGIHFTQMQTVHGPIPVALIGAVATDSNYRAQGISSTLLSDAISRAGHQAADWIFLWGSEHHFYKKFGFELMGTQGRAPVIDLPGNPHGEVTIQSGLTEKIFQSLIQQKKGIILKEHDREWFFNHSTVRWYSIDDPFAFVAYGRGMDLNHLIHEWGGDPQSLKKLFNHVLSFDPSAEILGRVEELTALGFDEKSIVVEYLCLARATPSPIGKTPQWHQGFWISGLSAC